MLEEIDWVVENCGNVNRDNWIANKNALQAEQKDKSDEINLNIINKYLF